MRSREAATLAVKILALFVLIGLPSAIESLAEHWNTLKALTQPVL